jgi:cell wall-associated NlpC family hydrolase
MNWVGIPFSWQGAQPGTYDCWTLVRAYLGEHGIDLPEYQYERYNLDHRLAEISAQPNWIPVSGDPQPLDVILLSHNGRPQHVGVLVEPDLLLHTSRRTGSLIQRLSRITTLTPYRQWRAYRWVA